MREPVFLDPVTAPADAAIRVMRSEVAVFALVVDAKDGAAEAFYLHHGFERFGTKSRQLIVSLKHFAGKE